MIDYKKLTTEILSKNNLEPARGPAPTELNLGSDLNQCFKNLREEIERVQNTKGKKYYTTDGTTLSPEPTDNAGEKSIRIFTTAPEPSPLDLYQRGLQFGRAALTVIQHTPQHKANFDAGQFINITDIYSKLMITLSNEMNEAQDEKEKLKIYKRAAEVTHCYLGAMSHLVETTCPTAEPKFSFWEKIKIGVRWTDQLKLYQQKKLSSAHADIKKASDMLVMMEPLEDVICTYIHKEGQEQTQTLQFSERLNPGAKTNVSDETKGWFKYNIDKHGDWFKNFVNQNWDKLKNKPAPSTARDLPHAANTWDEITVTTGSNAENYHESHSGRIGITTPYQYKGQNNTEVRIQHAADASRSVLETQYENMIARYESKWASLYKEGETITLPILHATYVAPTFFYSADRSFIAEKTAANEIVREELHRKTESKKTNGKTLNYKFNLLEVNNCINIHRHLAYNSPRDRDDSNKLIGFSKDLLTRVANKLVPPDQNFNITIAYLNSANTLPPRFKGPSSKEKDAIEAVVRKLDTLNIDGLNEEARSDLKLLIQASVELKRLNHESIFSPVRRWLNELPYVGLAFRPLTYMAALPFRFGGYLLSIPGKLLDAGKTLRQDFRQDSTLTLSNRITMAFSQFSSTLIGGRNKQTFKSALEEIIADKLGYSISGCKSALDRKGEVEVVKAAMLEHFSNNQSTLPDYYDVTNYNRFFVNHVMPMENKGHQIRLAATADYVGERKMWETLPGQYVLATDERKEMAVLGAAFRDPKSSKWQARWDNDSNPFKDFFPESEGASQASSKRHFRSNETIAAHDPTVPPPLKTTPPLSFRGSPSVSSAIQPVGARIVSECEGQQTIEQYKITQDEFQKNSLIESKVERVGIIESKLEVMTQHTYIFKDETPSLLVKHTPDKVRLETKREFRHEDKQIEILALQIKLMTDNGMVASITEGPDGFKIKLANRCKELGVSADKVIISDKSAPIPSAPSRTH